MLKHPAPTLSGLHYISAAIGMSSMDPHTPNPEYAAGACQVSESEFMTIPVIAHVAIHILLFPPYLSYDVGRVTTLGNPMTGM